MLHHSNNAMFWQCHVIVNFFICNIFLAKNVSLPLFNYRYTVADYIPFRFTNIWYWLSELFQRNMYLCSCPNSNIMMHFCAANVIIYCQISFFLCPIVRSRLTLNRSMLQSNCKNYFQSDICTVAAESSWVGQPAGSLYLYLLKESCTVKIN